MRVLLYVCFALVRRSEDPVVDEKVEVASVTPDAHVQVVRGEGSALLEAKDGEQCCGIPDAASANDLLVCKARTADACSGEDVLALDMAHCVRQDAPPCALDPVTTSGEAESDQELAEGESEQEADAGVGDSCDSSVPSSCGDGLVCSRDVCKYAAMEKCKPAGWFSASRCASHPYGNGHKFQCKTHRKLGDKRCCIPSGSKHIGEAGPMLAEQRPLTLKQYEAAHPGRKQTKDGISIQGIQLEEPKAYLTNYRTRRVQRFRREIVPGTGTMVYGKQKVMLTNACCSGWATYGRQGVLTSSPAEQKAEKVWFCGY
jgi:hypothetical protein